MSKKQWGHGYRNGFQEGATHADAMGSLETDYTHQRMRILMDVLMVKMQETDTLDKFIIWHWLREMIDDSRIFRPEESVPPGQAISKE